MLPCEIASLGRLSITMFGSISEKASELVRQIFHLSSAKNELYHSDAKLKGLPVPFPPAVLIRQTGFGSRQRAPWDQGETASLDSE